MSSLVISAVDPTDSEAVLAWNTVLRRGFNAGRTAAYWASDESTLARLLHPRPARTSVLLVATLDGIPVGAADAELDPGEPAEVEISVLPEHRRQGIGRALAQAVRKELCEAGAQIAQAEVYSDGGVAFARSCGLDVAHREHRMLLDLPVTAQVLAQMRAATPPSAEVTVRSWSGACPEDLVADFALLQSQMNEDVPMGTLTRRTTEVAVDGVRRQEQRMAEQGWILVRSLALVSGRAAGYTELFVVRGGDELVIQDDTLVDRAHRGHGIGRALKLANLRALDEVPEARSARWIQTYTAMDNAPMLALNRSIGFWEAEVLSICEGDLGCPNDIGCQGDVV